MHITKQHPIDFKSDDNREEILSIIRMIEFVRISLPKAHERKVEQYLHAAIESLSASIPEEN